MKFRLLISFVTVLYAQGIVRLLAHVALSVRQYAPEPSLQENLQKKSLTAHSSATSKFKGIGKIAELSDGKMFVITNEKLRFVRIDGLACAKASLNMYGVLIKFKTLTSETKQTIELGI